MNLSIGWMKHLTILFAIGAAAAGHDRAAALNYQFTKVAETGEQFTALGAPSINNPGLVVFKASLPDGREGVFADGGGAIQQHYLTEQGTSIIGGISVNDRRDVVFLAGDLSYLGAKQVLAQIDGQIEVVAMLGIRDLLTEGAINNSRQIAFRRLLVSVEDGTYLSQGFRSPSESVTGTIASTQPIISFPFFGSMVSPAINNLGQFVFADFINGKNGVYLNDRGAVSLIYEFPDGNTRFGGMSINDASEVAFALLPDRRTGQGVFGLFVDSGGVLRAIAGTDSGFAPHLQEAVPTLNNAGQIVFLGNQLDSGLGIFIAGNDAPERLIGVGDLLDGASVWSLSLGKESLNDRGQIVFAASFDDGRTAIFRADPIPEPATLTLGIAATVLLATSMARRRGRRSPSL